jgi:hypothetical protein
MIKELAERRVAKIQRERYGPQYNFGATYYDATDEAIRRGDRVLGTEHMLLALLVDPASPAAQAIGYDLEAARAALDGLDSEALAAIGVKPGITAGPVVGRPHGKLRLTPAAKAIFTSIPSISNDRRDGLGIVLNALLGLRPPDPAAELLAALGADGPVVSGRFAALERNAQT